MDTIPLQVFMVSSHARYLCVQVYWGVTDLEEGYEWDTGLALLMAVARFVLRLHVQKKLYPDDVVLMFACLIFISSQALLYTFKIDILYWHERLNAQNFVSMLENPELFILRFKKVLRIECSSLILTFASISAVKICFLLLFYQMITPLRRLLLAWKVTFGITIIFGTLCICATLIGALHFDAAMSSSFTTLFCFLLIMTPNIRSRFFTRSRYNSAPYCGHPIKLFRYHVGPIP